MILKRGFVENAIINAVIWIIIFILGAFAIYSFLKRIGLR